MQNDTISAGKSAPSTPESSDFSGKISIVASRYNAEFTDALVDSASKTIASLLPNVEVEVIRVPGAYEIPVVVEALCKNSNPAAGLTILMEQGPTNLTANTEL